MSFLDVNHDLKWYVVVASVNIFQPNLYIGRYIQTIMAPENMEPEEAIVHITTIADPTKGFDLVSEATSTLQQPIKHHEVLPNGVEGVAMEEAVHYKPFSHLVILHVDELENEGLRLISQIRQNASFSKAPLIVFAPEKNADLIRKCYEVGIHSYIIRPEGDEEAIGKIRGAINYWVEVNQFARI